MKNIRHCGYDNPVTETWFLIDNSVILFSFCEICKKKIATFGGKIFVDAKVEKLRKKYKKHVNYKDFDTPSIRNWGFVFGVNVEIHDCKGRIRAIKQKAKDFFGCENLIKEISSLK